MNSVQQIATGAAQMSSSATSVANALAKPRAATASTTPTTTTTTSGATITANDFLSLLVAEMKNQDPTQPTDPNAYITQMVGVNSLQQLVSINSGITTLDTAAGAAPPASGSVVTGTSPTTNAQAMALVDAMPATSSSGSSAGSTGTSSGANVSASGVPLWGSGKSN
jgi:flagellar basal-body rod modification protein FlgD